jgi:hypothetical protein
MNTPKPRLPLTRRIPDLGSSLVHRAFAMTGGDEDRLVQRWRMWSTRKSPAYDGGVRRPVVTTRPNTSDRVVGGGRPLVYLLTVIALLVVTSCLMWVSACDSGKGESAGGSTTSTTSGGEPQSGDIEGRVGAAIKVGEAVVTVRALQATFQPAMPEHRLSGQTPTAPAAGESFYQARVRVENKGVSPLRVDAVDFACAVGDAVVNIEPTRSGPLPRSLLKSTSLDLLLTFKAQAGFQPVLLYNPPWYDGTVRVSPQSEETTTTATT